MGDWQARALCAQVDPELWFPEAGNTSTYAKRICQRCPVRDQCLAAALAQHEQHGIWGGLNYYERLHHRGPQVVRQLESARAHARLITALTAEAAARELGVSVRTIQRWRTALQEAS
jgi:WhiB family redox-sensing transcriptional regulator